jgi:peptidyl-prolyl cis-trans isomerase A (cyclophilin A)
MKKLYTFLMLAVLVAAGCSPKYINSIAPEAYTARFETSEGNFDVTVKREYSPKAADRFYALVKSGYYKNVPFYRVVPNFVAQFGQIDTMQSQAWSKVKVPDEPVLYGNKKGTISFARSGRESRSTELFINLKDNDRLDEVDYNSVKGFPAFGYVSSGMEVVEKLYSGYGDKVMEKEALFANRKLFDKEFPEVDVIKKAYIISGK